MLKGILQTDTRLDKNIRSYGCLFLCFAYASPMIFDGAKGCKALNKIWKEAIKKGYIAGDLNGDGDMDDDGEAMLLDHNKIANEFFAMEVKYDNVHHTAEEKIPAGLYTVFGRFVWKGGHFVVLNKDRTVKFDPLGSSNAVKNGKLQSMRWYYSV